MSDSPHKRYSTPPGGHHHHHHHHGTAGSTQSSASGSRGSNIVAGHYQIMQKIGEGSFGIIFKGYDLLKDNLPVAIKFESKKAEAPQLKDEFKAYKILNTALTRAREDEPQASKYLSLKGIPAVYHFGPEGYYNVLVIQLLGPSLEDLFEWCGRQFSPRTVAQCARQMIARIQFVHENNLIYRDIKPDNFLVGATNDDNTVYLVDFGMIKQYRNPMTKQHIPYREHKSLSGTARYMSINTHLGREQSRRDDLESLGHVFIYFLRRELPWQGLKAPTNKLKYEKIGEKKKSTSIEQLCRGLPRQFAEYMTYVRSLKFEETPDYRYLVRLMDSVLVEQPGNEGEYDWMRLNEGRGWSWTKNKKINLNGYGTNNNNHTRQHRSTRALVSKNKSSPQLLLANSYTQQARAGGSPGMGAAQPQDEYAKIDENTALLAGRQNYGYDRSYAQQQRQNPSSRSEDGCCAVLQGLCHGS